MGASVTYTLSGTISPSAAGSLVNAASVAAPGSVVDTDLGNNAATDADALTPQADLRLVLSDSPDPVGAGELLTYTIEITNLGPSGSSGTTLTDTLPPEVVFSSSAPTCT